MYIAVLKIMLRVQGRAIRTYLVTYVLIIQPFLLFMSFDRLYQLMCSYPCQVSYTDMLQMTVLDVLETVSRCGQVISCEQSHDQVCESDKLSAAISQVLSKLIDNWEYKNKDTEKHTEGGGLNNL
jgi:hypothetical protein